MHPYIELKSGTTEQLLTLVNIVNNCGMLRGVTWISFHDDKLEVIKAADNKARLGLLVSAITDNVIAIATALKSGKNEVFIDSASYTDSEVNLCATARLPLEVWTVNDESVILGALPSYVSGVTSDSLVASKILYDAYIE
jgi:hypothetical protein